MRVKVSSLWQRGMCSTECHLEIVNQLWPAHYCQCERLLFMSLADEEEITFPPTYRFQKWTRDRYVWEKFKATGVSRWCDVCKLSSTVQLFNESSPTLGAYLETKQGVHWWYRDGADDTIEENSSIFSLIQMHSTACCLQGHAGSKTFLQQNPPVVNWECSLRQVVLYNCHRTVVVV